MGCISFSWFLFAPMATTAIPSCSSFRCHPFFLFNVSCCTRVTVDATSSLSPRSFARRWYKPLRPSRFDGGPGIERQWIEAEQPFASDDRVTVVSYNILADRNVWKHRYLYSDIPSIFLKWDRRKRLVCKELLGWNPDIICLQEVDKYSDLSNVMVKAGYIGSYKRRTGDSVDGCAIFWKPDKLRLLHGESIEFKGLNLRDNVAQLYVFEMSEAKAESRKLLIGNIHVLYNPRRGDVKLGQIRYLLSRAHILSKKWSDAPFVLAGDFNSTPQSAIYEFIASAELNVILHDRRELSGQTSHSAELFGIQKETSRPLIFMDRLFKYCWTAEEIKVATGDADCHIALHPFKLSSSYATVKGSTATRGSNDEPLATSYHAKFIGTVDYLWYSNGLFPTRVLDTISIDDLLKTGGLPCQRSGSDHLALVSEFAFPTQVSETSHNL